jgi:DNA-binding MarR family transcriptional regulator
MQPLPNSSKSGGRVCADEVMAAVPPVIWFMRRQMRGNRGGLSIAQFRALARVERENSASITAIADHLAASLSTTSRLVSGLVGRKFLIRETAPADRRQAHVSITQKGAAVLRVAREATGRELTGIFDSLEARERDRIIDAMQIFRRLFGSRVYAQPTGNGNGLVGGAKRRRAIRV